MYRLSEHPRPLIIGHRGAPVHAPENTFASFRLAIEQGCDVLETDLWLTKDGVMVCHHDETVDRVTDGRGAIPRMTLEQLKAVRVKRSYCGQFDEAAYPDEHIPTLQELLDFTPADVGLALELKDHAFHHPRNAALLIEAVRPRIERGAVMLLSFETDLLWAARGGGSSVWIGEVSGFNPNPTFAGNGVGTTYEAMRSNPHYMSTAREHNLWVCPLDLMPEEHLAWYIEADVDAVLSDHPDVTWAALAKLGKR
ncbi:MAG: glycerophosphodiester phosphodiesterase [Chloroflexota bacterium]|nr:glycerophosphodiester phosphodiesterase [Chloroflexota bacterium]